MRRAWRVSLYAGVLLIVTAAIAWVSGRPFVFPSLGPSAFALAAYPAHAENRPRNVIGGHGLGVVIGSLAYHALAPKLIITVEHAAWSTEGLRLAASAVVSVVGTSAAMLLTGFTHAPACATTLIVSLGLLSRPIEGAIIVLAVGVLVLANLLLTRRDPVS